MFRSLPIIVGLLLISCGSEPDDQVKLGVDAGANNASNVAANSTSPNTSSANNVADMGDLDAGSDAAGPGDAGFMPDADDPGLPDGPSSERLTPVTINTRGNPNGFYEYLPPGYGDGAPRPLLVFWHGLGENGNGDSELSRVLSNGPPRLQNRDEWSSERSFIVLSPQNPGNGCPSSASIDAFITWALETYGDAIDTARVYLTGLSCGAIGSWNYLSRFTDGPVAAAVLIAGDGRGAWNRAGCDLGNVAIWGFHGDADNVVNVSGTNVPIDNLVADCPNRVEANKTIYPGVGHNSWARTYSMSAGHDIYAWLLEFTR
jgi:predicted esterase